MPSSVILACEMLEDEVRLALKAVPAAERSPVVWVPSGLHDRPERLRETLRTSIAALDEAARVGAPATLTSARPGRGPASERSESVTLGPAQEVMLAMGFCGGALQGLVAENISIVFPRVDDCVSLLLGGGCAREQIQRDPRSYYVTRGWFGHESSLMEAFEDWEQRFGPERAAALRESMFAGYERIGLIDTGAYDLVEGMRESEPLAASLGLAHGTVTGSVRLLERLFSGERGGDIVVVPPGEPIEHAHLFGMKVGERVGQKGDQ